MRSRPARHSDEIEHLALHMLDPTIHTQKARDRATTAATRSRDGDYWLPRQAAVASSTRLAAPQTVGKSFGGLTQLAKVDRGNKDKTIRISDARLERLEVIEDLALVLNATWSPPITASLTAANIQIIQTDLFGVASHVSDTRHSGSRAGRGQTIDIWARTDHQNVHAVALPSDW
jgi:hypothetical protein